MSRTFVDTIENKKIVVCVGSGGVGKTTTAASFAIEAARRGKRALVLTIDPAKRLANSLGLQDLGHEVQEVPMERLSAMGDCVPGGKLSAMMLDQRQAFDEMVETYAKDPDAVKRIFANPMYQQISGTLTGSQEYAALTKLQAFDKSGDYDLIVVDTPPTAHALDFLDAPKKLSEAIDSPAIRMFQKMDTGGSLSVLGRSGNYILKKLAKFVGSQFIDDMALFFGEFNDILGGFKERATEVFALLRRSDVSFVIVTSPETLAIEEALFFHERLTDTDMPFAGFVLNKVHQPGTNPVGSFNAFLAFVSTIPRVSELGLQTGSLRIAAEAMFGAHADLQSLAAADRVSIQKIADAAPTAVLTEIPFFKQDVHQIESLAALNQHLFSPNTSRVK